jgi:hypothetical protein
MFESTQLQKHLETVRWLAGGASVTCAPSSSTSTSRSAVPARAVAERYARIADRHGVALDVSRYDDAREAAALNLKRHPELLHDDTIWHRFTEEIFVGMGGPEADRVGVRDRDRAGLGGVGELRAVRGRAARARGAARGASCGSGSSRTASAT